MSLTFFILITVERLVHRHIREGFLIRRPINGNPHDPSDEGGFTEMALRTVVSLLDDQIENGDLAIGLFISIEGVFNDSSRATIEAIQRSDTQ